MIDFLILLFFRTDKKTNPFFYFSNHLITRQHHDITHTSDSVHSTRRAGHSPCHSPCLQCLRCLHFPPAQTAGSRRWILALDYSSLDFIQRNLLCQVGNSLSLERPLGGECSLRLSPAPPPLTDQRRAGRGGDLAAREVPPTCPSSWERLRRHRPLLPQPSGQT